MHRGGAGLTMIKEHRIAHIVIVLVLGLSIGLFSAISTFTAKEYEQQLSAEDWHIAACT